MLWHPFSITCGSSPLIGTGTKALNPGGAGAKPPPWDTAQHSSIRPPERSVFRLQCSKTERRRRHKLLPLSEAGRPFIMHCGGMDKGYVYSRNDSRGGNFYGLRRKAGLWVSRERSYRCCWRALIGDTWSAPTIRSWRSELRYIDLHRKLCNEALPEIVIMPYCGACSLQARSPI